ncbi:MAG: alanine--tRNA ligase [Candidatus Aenigmarchaeota archaeon]|nr:alanine--tRNA ligase [Candidatus Aenigmarchaeota archaeon]
MNKGVDSEKLKELYLEFFKQNNHKIIPNAPLIPEEDPTVLFTTAGMHPLVRYLLGQPHPLGKRLANVQKCLRTDDIDEVGDESHLTFFEMLGNWSLGEYFKEDAIRWSFEFLTAKKWLGLDKKRLYISVFAGDKDAPRDEESAKIWQSLGIPKERIFYLPKKDNWWGPAGTTGPCGPDTEMFYDTNKKPCGKDCKPGCSCGKYFEIWNDVFMQYNKTQEGKYELLKQKNVDTGMGVERTVAALQNKKSVYEIETFKPIVEKIKKISKIKSPDEKQEKSIRIITDHIRASTFVLAEEIVPSNVDRGYILRRLIRRSIRHGKLIGVEKEFLSDLVTIVIELYKKDYPNLEKRKKFILDELKKEELKFRNTLERGLKKFEEIAKQVKKIDGKNAFLLFQSFGFPIEMTKELGNEIGVEVDDKGFKKEFERHQQISRVGSEKKFKGGLSDASEQSTKLHTATHLLNEALRRVLKKKDLVQKGSNITPERLRFDFNFDRALTEKEISDVENLVNNQIEKCVSVTREEMPFGEAKKRGAQAVFEQKYGEKVSVYSVGDFSIEVCGGPHVKNTKEVGEFKIIKEESIASGIRRIKAIVK